MVVVVIEWEGGGVEEGGGGGPHGSFPWEGLQRRVYIDGLAGGLFLPALGL